MIRVLHTADWHIGQTLNGWPRESEHRAFLAALADLVEAREIDALIVAGDVFDTQNPSAEATRLLYDTLVELRRRRPGLVTVIVAGNHDPAGRLEAPRALLAPLGVHVAGMIHRREGVVDLDRHLVPLPGRGGAIEAHVLAVPFPRAADLPGLAMAGEEPGSPVVRAVRRLYGEMIAAARAAVGGSPLIVTGHLHLMGADESEGAERRILIGGEHAVPADVFPADLAYVALGHLHKPQQVGRPSIRYAGSPFPLSATERPYNHGVTLLTVDGAAVELEHVPLPRPVPHLRLPERGALEAGGVEAALAALALDASLAVEMRPFVQIVVRQEGASPGLRAEIERLAEGHPIRLVGVAVERPAAATAEAAAPERLADVDPEELFRRAFMAAHGAAPESAHLEAFHVALTEG